MLYRAEVQTDDSGEWYGNGLTFETKEQAEDYALDLFSRWTMVREYRVIEVESR